jgi:hypothetical protein
VEEVPQEQVARVHDVVQVPAAARELEPGFDQSAPFGDPFVVSDLLAEVAVCDRGVLGRQSELERKVHRPSKIVDTATIARIDARDTPHAERTNDVGIADLARELDRLLGPFQPLLGAARRWYRARPDASIRARAPSSRPAREARPRPLQPRVL